MSAANDFVEPIGLTESLREWAQCKTHPSLWDLSPNKQAVIGTSKEFRRVFRPIFLKAYEVLYEKKVLHRTYANVVVGQAGLAVLGSAQEGLPSDDNIEVDDIKKDIEELKNLVIYVVKFQPPPKNPIVLDEFYELCKVAEHSTERNQLRYWIYFITKNPLIFTATERMRFLEKMRNLREMDARTFDLATTKASQLNSYIQRIDPSMKELDHIKNYRGQKFYSTPGTSIEFMENVERHYHHVPGPHRHGSTLSKIHKEVFNVLYDVIPCTYRAVAEWFGTNVSRFPLVHKRMNLIDFLEEEPYIITPKNAH